MNITEQLNKDIKSTTERLELIKRVLAKNPDIVERFYDYSKILPLSSKNKIYSETNAKNALENCANYILESEMVGEEIIQSYKKNHKDETLPRGHFNEDTNEYEPFEISNENVYKFKPEVSYTRHHLYADDTKANPYLWGDKTKDIKGDMVIRQSDYDTMPELAELWNQREKIQRATNFEGKSKLYDSLLSQMLAIKQHYTNPYQGKNIVRGTHKQDWGNFRFTREQDALAILCIVKEELSDMERFDLLELLVVRDEVLHSKVFKDSLTSNQSHVLALLQQGYEPTETTDIANTIGIKKQNVNKLIIAMVKKFIDAYIVLNGEEDYIATISGK